MSNKSKIPRAEALVHARAIHDALKDHCEKFVFAGSLRRGLAFVGDIEAVVIPKMEEVPDGLFSTIMVRSRDFNLSVHSMGWMTMGDSSSGRYCRIIVGGKSVGMTSEIIGGIQLDLFIPEPTDFGRQLAIRTGPGNYSMKLAARWRERGWCGVKNLGLRREVQCVNMGKVDGKPDWRLKPNLDHIQMPPEFHSEEDFYKFIGLDYVEPRNRV